MQFATPIGGDNREEWAAEFAETLKAVLALVKNGKIEPVVLLEIVRSVSWHAHHGDGAPAEVAKEIIAALPTTLEFRTTLALVDGYGMLTRRMGEDFAADRKELAAQRRRPGGRACPRISLGGDCAGLPR